MKSLNKALVTMLLLYPILLSNSVFAQYSIEREWSAQAQGVFQFGYPKEIVRINTGEFFVSDGGSLNKFSYEGELLNQWFSPSGYISSLVVDTDDNIIVACDTRVIKLNSEFVEIQSFGDYGQEDGQISFIKELATDQANNIYVLDNIWTGEPGSQGIIRLQVFSSTGIFLSKILAESAGYYHSETDYMFNDIPKICIGNDRLYMANFTTIYGNSPLVRVKEYNLTGEFISDIGSFFQSGGQLHSLNGLTIDNEGKIVVSDMEQIHTYDLSGNYLSSIHYKQGADLLIESDGNILIVQQSNNTRVQRLSQDGIVIQTIGGGDADGQFNNPTDCVVDSEGNLYVLESVNNRVQKFDQNGNFILKFGSEGMGDGQFNSPYRMTISRTDDIYVLDMNSRKVSKFDTQGNFLLSFGSEGTEDGQFTTAQDIKTDSEGNIYVLNLDGTTFAHVQKFNSSGQFLSKWGDFGEGVGQIWLANHLAIDNENNIYIFSAYPSGDPRLLKYTNNGLSLSEVSISGYYGWYLNNLESDKYGNIYAMSGNELININNSAISSLHSISGGWDAFGLWISPNTQNVYLTASVHDRVQKLVCSLPEPQFSVTPFPTGNLTVFMDESTNITPYSNYTWNFGDGIIDNTSSNVKHAYDSAGTYDASLSISQGCFSKIDKTFTIVDTVEKPSIQASNLFISDALATSMQINLTSGDGLKRLVVMKQGSAPQLSPVDGIIYSGTLENSEIIAYSGSESSFIVRNLIPDLEYYFTVFEYNQSTKEIKYLLDDAPVANERTLIQPNVHVISPVNGAINKSAVLNITSLAVTNATSYTIQISEDPDFINIVQEQSGDRIQSFTLSYGKTYFTRVRTDLSAAFGKTTSFSTLTPNITVVNPSDGSINVKTTLPIVAKALAGANEYTIELNESPDFSGEGIIQTGGRWQIFYGLKYAQSYYARVMTDIFPFYGNTTVFTTGIPNVFVTNPANGSTDQKVDLNVCSTEISGAYEYTIEINEQSDFMGIGFIQSGPRTQHFSGLNYNTQYYVRVYTDLSQVYGKVTTFTTADPSYFAYVSTPTNGAVDRNVSLTITSHEVVGASTYTIQLSETPDFSEIAFEVTGDNRQLTFTGLKYNTTYFNRVITDLGSTYGKVNSFTTRSAESISYVTSPTDGAINVNNNSLNISSHDVPGAAIYTIQLSTDPEFSTTDFESTGSSRTLNFKGLQYNTTYYNRVITDLASDYGMVRSFRTRTVEYLTYVTSPANNAENVSTTVNISSNIVPGATQYTVQLSLSSDFSSIAIELTGTGRMLKFSGLEEGRIYYNRVITNLSENFGEIRSFTTQGNAANARIAGLQKSQNPIELNEGFNILTYPNPFLNQLEVYIEDVDTKPVEVKLVDINGKILFISSGWETNGSYTISGDYKPGLYLMYVRAGNLSRTIKVLHK